MFATERTADRPWRQMLWGAGALLVIVFATTWITKGDRLTESSMHAASLISAFGTIGLAVLFRRYSPVSLRAYFTSAGILAAACLLSPVVFPDPAVWADTARTHLWMFPWFVMLWGGTANAKSQSCSRLTSRVMIGSSAGLAAIMVFTLQIKVALKGLFGFLG